MKKKPKVGRPSLGVEVTVKVLVRPEEAEVLKSAAKDEGFKSLSGWGRQVMLQRARKEDGWP